MGTLMQQAISHLYFDTTTADVLWSISGPIRIERYKVYAFYRADESVGPTLRSDSEPDRPVIVSDIPKS